MWEGLSWPLRAQRWSGCSPSQEEFTPSGGIWSGQVMTTRCEKCCSGSMGGEWDLGGNITSLVLLTSHWNLAFSISFKYTCAQQTAVLEVFVALSPVEVIDNFLLQFVYRYFKILLWWNRHYVFLFYLINYISGVVLEFIQKHYGDITSPRVPHFPLFSFTNILRRCGDFVTVNEPVLIR